MVMLFCAIVGVEGNAFSIDIDASKPVDQLKKAIRAEPEFGFPESRIELFLAKKGDKWLNKEDVAAVVLDEHGHPVGFDHMDPLLWIKNEKYFGEDFKPSEGEIHVLVVVPSDEKAAGLVYPRDRQLDMGGVNVPVTQTMRLNPPALVKFWQAFRNDETEIKAGAMIALPEGTYILGDSTLHSRIYIRHCYPPLLDLCGKIIHDQALHTPHLVILGNPGIGKTYFGYVILLHLARAGATVVYESGKSQQRFLFSQEVVVEGSQQDFIDILKEPTTYYIVDAVKPPYYSAKTILLTSPRRAIWWEFNKTNCQPCYMPVWSMNEIIQCRELMYSDTPENVVQDCYRRWGGIARYVLDFAQVARQQELLEKAMDIVDLDWLVNACGQLEANDVQVSHRLLHYRVSKTFGNLYFVFASKYVQQEVYKRLYAKNKRKLLEFIAASDGSRALAVLRGILFEGHVHSVLPRGGTFRVRPLVDNNEGNNVVEDPMPDEWDDEYEVDDGVVGDDGVNADGDVVMGEGTRATLIDQPVIHLPRCKVVVFKDSNELINTTEVCYLQPAVTNYQSVDAIIKPDMLFQVTGAHKHPCKQKGLFDVLTLLGNPSAPLLFFVVPPDRFTDFRYQKYVDSKRKTMAQASYRNVRAIQQFAMEVPLVSE